MTQQINTSSMTSDNCETEWSQLDYSGALTFCSHKLSYMLTKSFVFSNLFESAAFIIIIVDIIQYYVNVRNENKKKELISRS